MYNIYGLCNRHYVRHNLTIEPTTVHIDFKVVMHAVLREAIPSATIKCCSFHLWAMHLWWQKIQTIRFGAYRVEPTEVEDCFTEDIMPDCPDDKNCNKIGDYLLENYVIFGSKFTLDICAVIPSEEKRTNNGTELFHAHFNEQFYTSHPTIFIFNELYLAVTNFQLP